MQQLLSIAALPFDRIYRIDQVFTRKQYKETGAHIHQMSDESHLMRTYMLKYFQKGLFLTHFVNLTVKVNPTKRESQQVQVQRYFLGCVS